MAGIEIPLKPCQVTESHKLGPVVAGTNAIMLGATAVHLCLLFTLLLNTTE